MIQINSMKLIQIFWGFVVLSYKQVQGLDCPDGYRCVQGHYFYVWTRRIGTMRGAQKYCQERGLSLLRGMSITELREEILRPNITKVIKDNSTVWLDARYDDVEQQYRWEHNNEVADFSIRPDRGKCVVAERRFRKIVSAKCGDRHLVVCMNQNNDWFGDRLRFKCRCRSEYCSFGGKCPFLGGRCALGWFGRGCQLRSALVNAQNKLLDFDRDTCEENLTSPAYFNIHPPVYFSWIRLVARDTVDRDTFRLEVTTAGHAMTCNEPRAFIVNHRTVDLACCTNLAQVSQVVVKWRGDVTLCSVNIYRGQNVAIREKSTILSGTKVFEAGYIVDGDRGILSPSVSSSRVPSFESWTLELSIFRVVFEVVVYIREPLADKKVDVNITLELQNSSKIAVYRDDTQVYSFKEGTSRLRILSGSEKNVKFVKLHFSKPAFSDKYLDLSEVNVYGSCAPPYYHYKCNLLCSSGWFSNVCYYDGRCEEEPTSAITQPAATRMSLGAQPTATRPSGNTAGTAEVTTKKQPMKCPYGFIGKKCQYICHCKNEMCQRDGRCREGSSCEDGWFALACQYSDLAKDSEASDPLLTDNNDSTCYIPPTNVISANLTEPFLYTWVRVVFSHYANVFNFSMSFKGYEVCEHIRVVAEEKNQFDIFCSNEIVTNCVYLTWRGNGSICSLYINGGRNVAIEDDVSASNEEVALLTSSLKDGITDEQLCLPFPSDERNTLVFRYLDPQTVTRIIIYTERIEGEDCGFFLQISFDNNNNNVFYYKSTHGRRHVVYLSETRVTTAFNITLLIVEGSINVCEVEIYGDCAPPHYYLGCAETCILTCYKSRCNYNGLCYNCRHGRHGTHCMEGDVFSNLSIKPYDKQSKPKKAAHVNVYVYLFLPIIVFCACSYNVLEHYRRGPASGRPVRLDSGITGNAPRGDPKAAGTYGKLNVGRHIEPALLTYHVSKPRVEKDKISEKNKGTEGRISISSAYSEESSEHHFTEELSDSETNYV